MTFDRLLVIKRVEKPKHIKGNGVYWLCKCNCGSNIDVISSSSNLLAKRTRSCGCLNQERINNLKKYNKYYLSGEYGIGYTSKGEEFYFDLEDYDKIKDYYWFINSKGYVTSFVHLKDGSKSYITLYFHRIITNCSEDMTVDHINGRNTRNDNRKENLRICTHQENLFNKEIIKTNKSSKTGVFWNKTTNKWKSFIGYSGERINLGSFDTFEDAVKARVEAEIKYFGEFRNKNSYKRL